MVDLTYVSLLRPILSIFPFVKSMNNPFQYWKPIGIGVLKNNTAIFDALIKSQHQLKIAWLQSKAFSKRHRADSGTNRSVVAVDSFVITVSMLKGYKMCQKVKFAEPHYQEAKLANWHFKLCIL